MPAIISEFDEAEKQATELTELLYGEEHGADRYGEVPLFEQLRRGEPGLYTVPLDWGTLHRENVDFRERLCGCIRRLRPLFSDAADRGDSRTIAMSGRKSSGNLM